MTLPDRSPSLVLPASLRAGGALGPGDRYIERTADRELIGALLQREFCYVLAPRQIGKSSIRIRAAHMLSRSGVRCASVTLEEIGTQVTPEEWYFTLVAKLADHLGLPDAEEFWGRQGRLTLVERFLRFLKQQVLSLPGDVVIFIDEIDTVLSLPIARDDFFAAVRATYNRRAEDPEWSRLTFCLLGVAAPTDLMQDSARTPFNIGRAVRMEDFSRKEVDGFRPDLEVLARDPVLLLDSIYAWTDGHPYMTQRLCLALREQREGGRPIDVHLAVREYFLLRGRQEEQNLQYAEKRLDQHGDATTFLSLYRRLLSEEEVPAERADRDQIELMLCGMAAERVEVPSGRRLLRVRNRVFAQVFDETWVREKTADRFLYQAYMCWHLQGRRPELLLRDGDLQRALIWAREHRREVTNEESEYLEASQEAVVQQALADGRVQAQKELEEQREVAERTEKSVRAAAQATQPGQVLLALVAGMKAVIPEMKSQHFVAKNWEGVMAAAIRAVASLPLENDSLGISCVAFSPDGSLILTTSEVGPAQVWDALSLKVLLSLEGHPASVATFSPDGSRIVTGSSDKTARVWDALSGRLLFSLEGHSACIRSASFSPDGSCILTGSDDKTARVWDALSGNLRLSLEGHSDRIICASFSPDGSRIITGSSDTTARVWDGFSGKILLSLRGYWAWFASVSFSPDGSRILTGSDDKTARVWDALSGNLLLALEGHFGKVLSASFSPDGSRILTGSDDKTARVWDALSGKLLVCFEGHSNSVRCASFSPDGSRVVSGSSDTTVRLWDPLRGRALTFLEGHPSRVWCAIFSPDGSRVVTGSSDNTARIWHAVTGKVLLALKGHSARVLAASFSPDGSRIATGSPDRTARIWDAHAGKPVLSLEGHSARIWSVSFSPDGSRVLTGSDDRTARIWDALSGKALLSLEGHSASIWSVSFSPDGLRILTGSSDRTAQIWDALSGKPLLSLEGHRDWVRSVSFSPDGSRILTGSDDGTAQIWDAFSGKPLLSLGGHKKGISSASFSPDGSLVITGSFDWTARIWDALNGKHLLSLESHSAPVWSAAFSPNGRHVVTASADGTAIIHPARNEDYYAFGCRVLRGLRNYPGISGDDLKQVLSACPAE